MSQKLSNAKLVALMKEGDLNAKNQLIVQNMGLIVNCVSEIKNTQMDFEDLVQEAVAVLLTKLEGYDPEKGALSTFIWSTIRQYITASTQPMPMNLYRQFVRIRQSVQYLNECDKKVNVENIANVMDIPVSLCKKYLNQIESFNYVSLDKSMVKDEDSESLVTMLTDDRVESPEEYGVYSAMKDQLWRSIRTLPERQQQILILHYNLNNSKRGCLSLRQIAGELGTSYQNIAQIEKKSIEKIRFQMGAAA